MDDQRARALLDAERVRVAGLLDDLAAEAAGDRSAADEPGDVEDSAEPLTSQGLDDAVAAGLRERMAALERAESAPRRGHLRPVHPERPAHSRRSPRSRPGRRAHRGRGRTGLIGQWQCARRPAMSSGAPFIVRSIGTPPERTKRTIKTPATTRKPMFKKVV